MMKEEQWGTLIEKNQNHLSEPLLLFKSIKENDENNNINSDLRLKPFKANIVTITQTHVFTSTIYPSSSALPSSSYLPSSTQRISSSSSSSLSSSTPLIDNKPSEQWQLSFPVLLTFSVIGILCLLSVFVFCLYYFLKKYNFFHYLKRKIHQDIDDGDDEKTLHNEKYSHSYPFLPSTSSHILNDVYSGAQQHSWPTINYSNPTISIKDINHNNSSNRKKKNNNNNDDDDGLSHSSTFIPIEASTLTLVPRSLILNDPNRRRGVDELDLWEKKQYQQKQQQQSSSSSSSQQRQLTNVPIENNVYDAKVEIENKKGKEGKEGKEGEEGEGDDDDDDELSPSNNMDNDRPWHRYKLKSPQPQSQQLFDIVQVLNMQVLDQGKIHSNRSSDTILQSRPISIIQDDYYQTLQFNRENQNQNQNENNDQTGQSDTSNNNNNIIINNNNNKVSDVVIARRVLKASALELSSSQSLSSTASSY